MASERPQFATAAGLATVDETGRTCVKVANLTDRPVAVPMGAQVASLTYDEFARDTMAPLVDDEAVELVAAAVAEVLVPDEEERGQVGDEDYDPVEAENFKMFNDPTSVLEDPAGRPETDGE